MAVAAERLESIVTAFEALRHDARFGAASAARERAFDRFLARGFPTTRDEEWRFTNVAPIADVRLVPAPALTLAADSLTPFALDGSIPIVLINGRLAPALSAVDRLPAGVTVRALASDPPGVGDAAARGNAFVDLNTAFAEETVAISVAPGSLVAEPLHVICVTAPGAVSDGNSSFHDAKSKDLTPMATPMASPRLVIDVGEHAQVSVVESYAVLGTAAVFTNGVTDIRAGASAVVKHVKLQREPVTSFHLSTSFVHLSRASTVASCAVTLGGRIARNDILARLDGEGAECTLNGLYVASGESLVDTHTTIHHAKPHCPSHEVYKGILAGRARAVFNGKIVVAIDAQKTDAKQTNKALLLSDDAQINTKPQLEIFADDVKCTHGAAIGQLDEDAMFYLRARGISEVDARNLLIHAFAGEVLDRIGIDAVRDLAMRLLEDKLGVVHL